MHNLYAIKVIFHTATNTYIVVSEITELSLDNENVLLTSLYNLTDYQFTIINYQVASAVVMFGQSLCPLKRLLVSLQLCVLMFHNEVAESAPTIGYNVAKVTRSIWATYFLLIHGTGCCNHHLANFGH